MRIELMTGKLALMGILLFRIPSCSDQGQKLDDGKFVSETQAYRDYRLDLRSFLTSIDSMRSNVSGPIVPPVKDPSMNVDQDTLVTGETMITVGIDDGHYVYFRDIFNPETLYSLKAYDNKNRVAYIKEIKKDGYFRVFGVSLNTGNQFTVYQNSSKDRNQYMYEWTFNSELDRLLKTGDIDEVNYGWSLTDINTGIESKVSFDRYREFIIKPMWINDQQFRYTYIEIPFWEGYFYDKGYEYFNSLMNQRPMKQIRLKYDYLYSKDYVLDVKGYVISEKMNIIQYKPEI